MPTIAENCKVPHKSEKITGGCKNIFGGYRRIAVFCRSLHTSLEVVGGLTEVKKHHQGCLQPSGVKTLFDVYKE